MGALASVTLRAARALRELRGLRIRTLRPTDAEALQDFVRRLSDRSRYLRFFRPLPERPPWLLKQLLEADGLRDQVLVAVAPDAGGTRIVGLAQFALEADNSCEFALVIADDWQGRGLGRRLMRALLGAAQAAGVARMRGDVLLENRAMLGLARALGFSVSPSPLDATALRVTRELDAAARRASRRIPAPATPDAALLA
jgi:acetyltransferase